MKISNLSETPLTDEIGIDHVTSTETEYKFRKLSRKLEKQNNILRAAVEMLAKQNVGFAPILESALQLADDTE